MQFNLDSPTYSYVVEKESGEEVLYINYNGAPFIPDICESSEVMERTIEVLIENPSVSRIVFVQSKNYNYDFKETSYLLEIAQLYNYLLNQEKILTHSKLIKNNEGEFSSRYNDLFGFLTLLKKDPVAAYLHLKRILFEAKIMFEKIS
ncbi:MAG: hypothetical protein PHW45_04335, partial [Candidatus ainarchaeum sp.]|nr:hypothetical protein [Candidatus ainarchaeum sp.]